VPIVAMTREMGALGVSVAQGVGRALDFEVVRHDIIRAAAGAYRVRESRLIGVMEEAPGLLERLRRRGFQYRAYVEAAVLEAALRERVVLVGRWSTLFLRGVSHAVRVRVCAPPDARARRVAERYGLALDEAVRRIGAYDEGVRARMRQIFDVDWTDPLLYDLVINTETVSVSSAVRQVVDLVGAAEFQPTAESRQRLADRALAARVRATLRATPGTGLLEVDVQAAGGRVSLAGVVASDAERDAALAVARDVTGVSEVTGDVRVFRRPVR
jgi:cytidylate kinase